MLKTPKSSGWLLLCIQGAYRVILLVCLESTASQVDHAVVSCSLSMRCIMADVELRDTVEVLDPLVGPIVCQLRCSVDFVSLPPIPYLSVLVFFSLRLLTHLWHYDGLVASDYDHISFLLKWMEQCDSTGLSMLRMLLGFCPTYFCWVIATCHIDTWSCPQIRVSGKKDTE